MLSAPNELLSLEHLLHQLEKNQKAAAAQAATIEKQNAVERKHAIEGKEKVDREKERVQRAGASPAPTGSATILRSSPPGGGGGTIGSSTASTKAVAQYQHERPVKRRALQLARAQRVVLMQFEGCKNNLHASIILRGESTPVLKQVKKVLRVAIHVAYHLSLETAFLFDQCATYEERDLEQLSRTYAAAKLRDEKLLTAEREAERENMKLNGIALDEKQNTAGASASRPATTVAGKDDLKKSSSSLSSSSSLPAASLKRVVEADVYSVPLSTSPFIEPPSMMRPKLSLSEYDLSRYRLTAAIARALPPDMEPTEFGRQRHVASERFGFGFGGNSNENDNRSSSDSNDSSGSNLWLHQSILLGVCWLTSQWQCLMPDVRSIDFYQSANDKTVGQFLVDNCFDLKLRCSNPKCKKDVTKHILGYAHHDGRVIIMVNRIPPTQRRLWPSPPTGEHGSQPADGHNGIYTRSWCRQCNRWVSDFTPLSEQSYHYSFGKFLESTFHNPYAVCRGLNGCGHSISQNHVRVFAMGDLIASVKYERIVPYRIIVRDRLTYNEYAIARMRRRAVEILQLVALAVFQEFIVKIAEIDSELEVGDDRTRLRTLTEKITSERELFAACLTELGANSYANSIHNGGNSNNGGNGNGNPHHSNSELLAELLYDSDNEPNAKPPATALATAAVTGAPVAGVGAGAVITAVAGAGASSPSFSLSTLTNDRKQSTTVNVDRTLLTPAQTAAAAAGAGPGLGSGSAPSPSPSPPPPFAFGASSSVATSTLAVPASASSGSSTTGGGYIRPGHSPAPSIIPPQLISHGSSFSLTSPPTPASAAAVTSITALTAGKTTAEGKPAVRTAFNFGLNFSHTLKAPLPAVLHDGPGGRVSTYTADMFDIFMLQHRLYLMFTEWNASLSSMFAIFSKHDVPFAARMNTKNTTIEKQPQAAAAAMSINSSTVPPPPAVLAAGSAASSLSVVTISGLASSAKADEKRSSGDTGGGRAEHFKRNAGLSIVSAPIAIAHERVPQPLSARSLDLVSPNSSPPPTDSPTILAEPGSAQAAGSVGRSAALSIYVPTTDINPAMVGVVSPLTATPAPKEAAKKPVSVPSLLADLGIAEQIDVDVLMAPTTTTASAKSSRPTRRVPIPPTPTPTPPLQPQSQARGQLSQPNSPTRARLNGTTAPSPGKNAVSAPTADTGKSYAPPTKTASVQPPSQPVPLISQQSQGSLQSQSQSQLQQQLASTSSSSTASSGRVFDPAVTVDALCKRNDGVILQRWCEFLTMANLSKHAHAHFSLPPCIANIALPIYDDEPSSMLAYRYVSFRLQRRPLLPVHTVLVALRGG